MKRNICMMLILSLLLCGCATTQKDTLTFTYLRREATYGSADSILMGESREIKQNREDISHLIRVYLQGPLDDALRSPFPLGTKLIHVDEADGRLTITLSDAVDQLEGIQLTLAAGCLASTCFSMTEAREVRLLSESSDEPIFILDRNSLILFDTSGNSQPTD